MEANASIARLSDAAWALSAVLAAVECGLVEALDRPRTEAELAEVTGAPEALVAGLAAVLCALGLAKRDGGKVAPQAGLQRGTALEFLRADMRATVLQSAELAAAARERRLALGWRYTDPLILEAQGVFSAAAFERLSAEVFPAIAGLEERLRAAGARALDVGSGVGGTAIALCRAYPALSVVGVDPAPAPMALARAAVAGAGFRSRIELRASGVEELADREAFDLVWLPQLFLSDEVLARALPRLLAAMRPGAVLLTFASPAGEGDLAGAVGRLRSLLAGGAARSREELVSTLRAAGFAEASPLSTPLDATFRFVVARRA